ncbi:MAG: hypothetical protein ACK5MD_04745 [Flavobacteriales bacterium]
MNSIDSIISFLNKENYYTKASALFRVLLCSVLLLDFVFHIESIKDFYSLNTWFESSSQSSFLIAVREHVYLFFSIYAITLILYLLGIGRNLTAGLFFLLFIIKFILTPEVTNWIDRILLVTVFYMVFVDSFSRLTLFKYKTPFLRIDKSTINLISNLAVCLIIGNIFLIYADNGIAKLFERDWLNGQAFYFSVKHMWIDGTGLNDLLANNIYISAVATYGTLLSQALFVPLVLMKRTKNFIVGITILFHLIVAVCFYLYKFQAIMISLHLFMYTDQEMLQGKFLSKLWKAN